MILLLKECNKKLKNHKKQKKNYANIIVKIITVKGMRVMQNDVYWRDKKMSKW